MKIKLIIIVLFLVRLPLLAQESPVQFSEDALNNEVETEDNRTEDIRSVLEDVWASWCKDCVAGFPALKALQKEEPDVAYVFLSVDNERDKWLKGIDKYDLEGSHYRLGAWEGDFTDFIGLDWIPRYIIVGPDGKIQLMKAIKVDDPAIMETIKKLKNT